MSISLHHQLNTIFPTQPEPPAKRERERELEHKELITLPFCQQENREITKNPITQKDYMKNKRDGVHTKLRGCSTPAYFLS
jgi:hypothetical protein